jgi:hypothetical protein
VGPCLRTLSRHREVAAEHFKIVTGVDDVTSILGADVADFPFRNHVHFVFGDFVEELVTACWVLGVRPILLPADALPAASAPSRE